MTFGAITSDAVQIGGSLGNVNRNAPFVILQFLGVFSVLGMFVNTAFVATAAMRDFELKTDELFFSKPVSKRDYLLGRFFGSVAISVLVYFGPALGILIGSFMPWLEPERLGPFMASPYVFAMLVLILPNVLLTGAIFFAIAAWTRSMLATYLGTLGLLAGYLFASSLMSDIEDQQLAVLLDPFGLSALSLITRYFTVIERNTLLPPIAGPLLNNRLIWIAVAVIVLAVAIWRFRAARSLKGAGRGKKAAVVAAAPTPGHFRPIRPSFEPGTTWRQFLSSTRFETSMLLKGILFLIMLGFGAFNIWGAVRSLGRLFGTEVYPVTYLMIEAIGSASFFLLAIILTFYAGELIWRERTNGLADVFDALPTKSGVFLASKGVALAVLALFFLAGTVLATIVIQAANGYYNFELPLYFKGLLVNGYPFLLIAVLAIFLQVMLNQKFVAYLAMILFMLSEVVLNALDLDHVLYRFASFPSELYSDLNGFGHFLRGTTAVAVYWTFAAVIMLAVSSLFWMRGRDSAWHFRRSLARQRFKGAPKLLLIGGSLLFLASGAYVFYNTNVVNTYLTPERQRDLQVSYEQKYRQYRELDLPRLKAVKVDVDIDPHRHSVKARGRYTLENTSTQPQKQIHFNIDPRVKLKTLELPPYRLSLEDKELGYTIVELEQPLAPAEKLEMGWSIEFEQHGFVNGGADTSVIDNGTFFNNLSYFPNLGYLDGRELGDRNERRERGLPPEHRWPKIDDEAARRFNYLSREADWVDFETTVSTSADQIAIAPGYLQREWVEGDRRYFHYKMDAPILHFYSYLSAAYAVKRDQWNGVAIEIYYDPKHPYNIDRMIDGIKKSLDYFTREFGPYQHRQVRILEFPRYATFAQSFPNTIPFSESIGFIARIDDEEDIDYVFYVTAHEVAHQWWAHQVIGAEVQGGTMLSESFAQYSALMVMEKEYGRDHMRRFLKYELDNYLRSRGQERVEELPLMLVENQPYIHYRKASVLFYALRDAVGEEALNKALRRFRDATAFQPPPYPTTAQFLDFLRQETPPEQQALLDDYFQKITLFDNRISEASWRPNGDGTFAVTLKTSAKKVYADGQGVETAAKLDDWVDVGVFGPEDQGKKTLGKVLFLEKRRVTEPEQTFEITVAEEPRKAGIDPYNKLVDRNSNDNLKSVGKGD